MAVEGCDGGYLCGGGDEEQSMVRRHNWGYGDVRRCCGEQERRWRVTGGSSSGLWEVGVADVVASVEWWCV
ncbi:hypothetical protein QVD17_38143 [Tagetes erecta]|uniref:Uncharacterized protein n=1 Tax=Tagetes erecta TaxID=13708 RepID=A0AAD8NJ59_TARER|nr:hypothetical protein QVD17_38143 [Tagetes erecta]